MDDKKEKLDKELSRWIQSDGLHQAPQGFAERVMYKIQQEKEWKVEPLISRRQWLYIVGFILGMFGLSFFTETKAPERWDHLFPDFNFSLSVSPSFLYGLIIFTVFMLLQIYLIKNRMDQQYS